MEEKLAKIISVVFQPLLIPTYTIIIIFSYNSYLSLMIPFEAKRFLLWMVFLSTFVLPLVFILFLYKRGMIKTVNMDQKEERIFPLIITVIFYFMAYYIVRQTQLDTIYQRLFLGSAVIILLALFISFSWKISMHMLGVGGLIGALIGINQVANIDVTVFVVAAVIISGFVGFARLKLKAHNQAQVYTGFLTGVLVMLIFFLVK